MAGDTSRENGKKGGRKKGLATIEADKMKEYIAKRVAENGEAIVSVLLEKSLDGDIPAIKELFDRGFGKATQPLAGDKDNPLIPIPLLANVLCDISNNKNSKID
jgi:hypothetical protein